MGGRTECVFRKETAVVMLIIGVTALGYDYRNRNDIYDVLDGGDYDYDNIYANNMVMI